MIYNENASKYHKAMGVLLEELNLTGLGIYQEHNVKDICPNHPNSLDRFDFYVYTHGSAPYVVFRDQRFYIGIS